MEGAALRAKREFDIALVTAWHTEAFARTKKLPKLDTILGQSTKPRRSTFADAHAFFGRLKANGAPITIN